MATEVFPEKTTYGRWTLIARVRAGVWTARCECGTVRDVKLSKLRSGWSKSCGCLKNELTKARMLVHGHSADGIVSREMKTWIGMIDRCYSPNNPKYPSYGGRGIKVCDRWLGPEGLSNFVSDMGPRPEGLSIDRSDNDGNYEPGNCRWATNTQQQRNKRNNRIITFKGETLSTAEWEEHLGLRRGLVSQRIDALGWSVERALTEAVLPIKRGVKSEVFEWLRANPGEHSIEEIGKGILVRGSAHTVTTLLSALVNEKKIMRTGRGIYSSIPTEIP